MSTVSIFTTSSLQTLSRVCYEHIVECTKTKLVFAADSRYSTLRIDVRKDTNKPCCFTWFHETRYEHVRIKETYGLTWLHKVRYEQMFEETTKTVVLTWLHKMSAYSAAPKRRQTNDSIASRKA